MHAADMADARSLRCLPSSWATPPADRIRMTLAGGVLAWHINGQRAAEVRGVPSGVHFGVGRFDGTVEVRIERAAVAGAAGCRAMLRPLCGLMGREGNALRTGCGWAATARGPRATARRSRRRWARRRAWWRSSTWEGGGLGADEALSD
eukprot:jgi/Chrpa1/12803/Chrysochromulina_OHIO_Genome00019500-RA